MKPVEKSPRIFTGAPGKCKPPNEQGVKVLTPQGHAKLSAACSGGRGHEEGEGSMPPPGPSRVPAVLRWPTSGQHPRRRAHMVAGAGRTRRVQVPSVQRVMTPGDEVAGHGWTMLIQISKPDTLHAAVHYRLIYLILFQ